METRNTLVVLSLRGGADGLSVLVPYAERAYYDARPTIAIPPPGAPGASALELDDSFALHPSLAPLLGQFESGRLAFVHAVGWPGESHSHFEITDQIEAGSPAVDRPQSGWLARCLATRPTIDRSPLRAVAFGATPARSLAGELGVLTTMELPTYLVSGDSTQEQRIGRALRSLYQDDRLLGPIADRALHAWDSIRALDSRQEHEGPGGGYPRSALGRSLRDVETLVSAGVGLEAVTIEHPGWDTHVLQGGTAGAVADRLADLAASLAAFANAASSPLERTTIVVVTEFGRRVQENGGAGTDHGCGSVMMLLGARVRGGRLYGDWPGLGPDRLTGPGDLVATTDVRDVLSELVAAEFGDSVPAIAFPGFRQGVRIGCAA
jgi:uncharacterized protein (DUF1501 family)